MSAKSPFTRPTRKTLWRVSQAVIATTLVAALILALGNWRDTSENTDADPTGSNPEIEELMRPGAPFTFVENKGQWDSRARFVAQNGNMTAWIERDGITLQLEQQTADDKTKGVVTRLTFVGASEAVQLEGEKQQGTTRSYFMGNDRSKWQSGVAGYAQVIYHGLYPGVDLRLRPHEGKLEYDLLLQPGADLEQIVIECTGTDGLDIQDDGSLLINTALGAIRQKLPLTWYELASGEKQPVTCHYDLLDEESFGFAVPDLNPALALVIDPGLEWSTFLGGPGLEFGNLDFMVVDEGGDIFLAGSTDSPDFPVTSGAYDTSQAGDFDVFVARLNPDLIGSDQLIWSTFLGGSGKDDGFGLKIDADGQVLVTGRTGSPNFPTTINAYDTTSNGGTDGFVARLDRSGSTLLYSTFIGGSESDEILNFTIGSSNDITVTGWTFSPDFPTTSDAFDNSQWCEGWFCRPPRSRSSRAYSTSMV